MVHFYETLYYYIDYDKHEFRSFRLTRVEIENKYEENGENKKSIRKGNGCTLNIVLVVFHFGLVNHV